MLTSKKLLTKLLYKKNYCPCIPDPEVVASCLQKLDKAWIKEFLLQKNVIGFSVIPMFMLIFIKNKRLEDEKNQRLSQLITRLVQQLDAPAIGRILLELERNCIAKSDLSAEERVCLVDMTKKLIGQSTQPTIEKKLLVTRLFDSAQDCFHYLFTSCVCFRNLEKTQTLDLNEKSPLISPMVSRV
ncbi:MAG: hypothetical protein V4700_03175 [Pseudomonadota bacterium]